MKSTLSLLAMITLALAGCGNAAPTVTAFTLAVSGKDASGNTALDGKVSAEDPDEGDRIAKIDVSATGPAVVPAQSITIPTGTAVKDLPIRLLLAANAPKGEYTFSLVAYDEAGEPSPAVTTKATLP